MTARPEGPSRLAVHQPGTHRVGGQSTSPSHDRQRGVRGGDHDVAVTPSAELARLGDQGDVREALLRRGHFPACGGQQLTVREIGHVEPARSQDAGHLRHELAGQQVRRHVRADEGITHHHVAAGVRLGRDRGSGLADAQPQAGPRAQPEGLLGQLEHAGVELDDDLTCPVVGCGQVAGQGAATTAQVQDAPGIGLLCGPGHDGQGFDAGDQPADVLEVEPGRIVQVDVAGLHPVHEEGPASATVGIGNEGGHSRGHGSGSGHRTRQHTAGGHVSILAGDPPRGPGGGLPVAGLHRTVWDGPPPQHARGQEPGTPGADTHGECDVMHTGQDRERTLRRNTGRVRAR